MCTFTHVIEHSVEKNKRAEIQESILALNFYMWKRFTGQQYLLIEVFTHLSVGRDAESEASFGG